MNFLADESVGHLVVEHLRQEGHRVLYIAELGPGMPDEAVLNLANQETALLLTADKDFGEMVFRQGLNIHGVVLIRPAGLTSQSGGSRFGSQGASAGTFTFVCGHHARDIAHSSCRQIDSWSSQ
jgi:predicted nuclease of predicted toxin-antitoxin system